MRRCILFLLFTMSCSLAGCSGGASPVLAMPSQQSDATVNPSSSVVPLTGPSAPAPGAGGPISAFVYAISGSYILQSNQETQAMLPTLQVLSGIVVVGYAQFMPLVSGVYQITASATPTSIGGSTSFTIQDNNVAIPGGTGVLTTLNTTTVQVLVKLNADDAVTLVASNTGAPQNPPSTMSFTLAMVLLGQVAAQTHD